MLPSLGVPFLVLARLCHGHRGGGGRGEEGDLPEGTPPACRQAGFRGTCGVFSAVPSFIGAGGLNCVAGGGSVMGDTSQAGCRRGDGEGPGAVFPLTPCLWGRWESRAACPPLATASACPPPPRGRAVVLRMQQGIDVHSLSQSRAMSPAVPRQPPVPITGVASSVLSRTCRSPARGSSP